LDRLHEAASLRLNKLKLKKQTLFELRKKEGRFKRPNQVDITEDSAMPAQQVEQEAEEN
jgi:hypothetical protein